MAKPKKAPEDRLKVGAKLKCTPELIQRAYELSSNMLLDYQIANSLNISLDSFYKYKRENSDFSEALKKGLANTLEQLTTAAKQRAKTDPVMQMFLLKNKGDFMEHWQARTIEVKERELELKEKIFRLTTEKFISELCEKHELNKEETLALLKQHLDE